MTSEATFAKRLLNGRRAPFPRGVVLVAALGLAACGGAQPKPDAPLVADPAGGAGETTDAPPQTDFDRAVALVKQERYEEAKPIFAQVHAAEPKRADAAFFLALTSEKTNDRQGAENAYKAALAADPTLAEAAQNLAALYLDEPARPDEAIAVLEKMLAKVQDDVRLLQNLAYAYDLKKDVATASKYYEKALSKGENGLIRLDYGRMLLRHDQHDKAAEQLRKVLAATGEDAAMLATVGTYLADAKAFPECVKAIDRAVALTPKDAELLVLRGRCKNKLQDRKGARSDFEAAIAVDPQSMSGHYYLALLLLDTKDPKNKPIAIAQLEKVTKLGPGTPMAEAAAQLLAKFKK